MIWAIRMLRNCARDRLRYAAFYVVRVADNTIAMQELGKNRIDFQIPVQCAKRLEDY